MRKLLSLLSLAVLSVSLTQCTPKKTTTANTMTDAEKVAEVKKNFTPQQLEEGKMVFETSCNKCHKLKGPETRSVAKWERVLPRMSSKAKLSDDDAAKVRAYVLANTKVEVE